MKEGETLFITFKEKLKQGSRSKVMRRSYTKRFALNSAVKNTVVLTKTQKDTLSEYIDAALEEANDNGLIEGKKEILDALELQQ